MKVQMEMEMEMQITRDQEERKERKGMKTNQIRGGDEEGVRGEEKGSGFGDIEGVEEKGLGPVPQSDQRRGGGVGEEEVTQEMVLVDGGRVAGEKTRLEFDLGLVGVSVLSLDWRPHCPHSHRGPWARS